MTRRYDVVIVGAGIAGSAAAIRYGREGLRVALLERSPDPQHFKRACTHTISAAAVPILDELGLSEELAAVDAPRHNWQLYTRYGWVRDDLDGYRFPKRNCTVRREVLDPMLRRHAVRSGDVDLMSGWTVERLLRADGRIRGVIARDRAGTRVELQGALVIGADGRGSRVATEAGLRERRRRHERFAVWGYFENVELVTYPDSQIYFLDPDCAYLMPTDSGLTILVIAVHKRHLPEYKRDPEGFYWDYVRRLPNAPRLEHASQVGEFVSRLDMTNIKRRVSGPGVALIGDAACAVDPVWGWGCGWALKSSQLLADATIPALRAGSRLDGALRRYRWRHLKTFAAPYELAADYSSGRGFNVFERILFAAAVRDQRVAWHLHSYVTTSIGVRQLVAPGPALRAVRVALSAQLGGLRYGPLHASLSRDHVSG
jgi:flavin-dependent dehydrogenase